MLLLYDRWQQRDSQAEWRLTWKCVWSRGVSLNSSMQEKLHPLTFIDACWTFMHCEAVGGAFQQWQQWYGREAMLQMAMHSCHEMKSHLSSSVWISRLQSGNCVRSWILASVCWKWWWWCWNIKKFVPGGSHKCSHSKRKNTLQVCQDLLNQYKAKGDSSLECNIVRNKIWYYHYELESRQQLLEWQCANCLTK